MDQVSFFDVGKFWIPEIYNDCRMWKCPVCMSSVVGQPLNWYQFNYYRFCPYCGTRLYTYLSDVSDQEGLPGD